MSAALRAAYSAGSGAVVAEVVARALDVERRVDDAAVASSGGSRRSGGRAWHARWPQLCVLAERVRRREEHLALVVEPLERVVAPAVAVAVGPVVVAGREHRRRLERVERRLRVGVHVIRARSPLPALRSPSCTVKASSWRFMSAIRLGTPTVFCIVRVGQVAPQADGVRAVLSVVAARASSWATASAAVAAAATSAAKSGMRNLRMVRGTLPPAGPGRVAER